MTPETTKKLNVAAGSTLAVLGIILVATSVFFGAVPATPIPTPVNPLPIVSVSSCRDVLNNMGYSATLANNGVTAKDSSLEDPHAALVKATAAMGLCKLQLEEFCMGSGCSEPGLTFTLKGDARASVAEKVALKADAKAASAKKAAPAK